MYCYHFRRIDPKSLYQVCISRIKTPEIEPPATRAAQSLGLDLTYLLMLGETLIPQTLLSQEKGSKTPKDFGNQRKVLIAKIFRYFSKP